MNKYRFILFSILCFVVCVNANATHNRAGEITYLWLNGYTFQIKVTIFTEISGTNMPDRCEDTVYFGDGTSALVSRSNGASGLCSPPALNGVPISSSVKLNEYVTTHTYPGSGNYLISTEDPNRTAGIINIPNSVNQTFYLESLLVIPTSGSSQNSSPTMSHIPLDTGCVNQCFYHNPSATDTDGDSISYELTYCRGSFGSNSAGYSYPSSGPGGIFHLDSITGIHTWCNPQLQGDYNVATLIKEWRKDSGGNYFLIGYVLRDAQFIISTCTSINELNGAESTINVSPNPVTENLTVTLNQNNGELFTIELIDITGCKIKTFANNESLSKENQFVLNLETIQIGIYFLQFIGSNNTSITKKIIKQ